MPDPLALAFPAIDRYARQLLAEGQGPSYVLAITDRDATRAVYRWGTLTDGGTQEPSDDTLYEIGSIGKSFTAIVLLQLVAEGLVDLHAPIADQLPYWRIPSEFEPITPHHLLTHTSGLGGGSDHVPAPEYELWLAQQALLTRAPNTSFIYSNLGYKALGLLIEHVTGTPYDAVVRERILAPLGLDSSEPAIRHEIRARLAPGHEPAYDDRPGLPRHGLVPATWLQTNTADGCLAMTAPDLAAYLRTLLRRGIADSGARILSDEQFATMISPHQGETPDPDYGYGIEHLTDGEVEQIGHSGGMVGWLSDMRGDLASGYGVAVLNNGVGDPTGLGGFALKAVVAAHNGDDLPEVPPPSSDAPLLDAEAYLGVFEGTGRVEVIRHGESLAVVREGVTHPLLHLGHGDDFLLDEPGDDLFPFRFLRTGEGQVSGIAHGARWYANEHDTGPRDVVAPPEWSAFVGLYRSYNPWSSPIRIVVRRGLLLALMNGGYRQSELRPDGDGFLLTSAHDPEQRVHFEPVVNGRALAMRFDDGTVLSRFFTP